MILASPLYLLLLVPWAALVAWLLWGRRPTADVPFVELWRGPVAGAPVRREVRAPPPSLILALLAVLLAILAAAGPRLPLSDSRRGPRVTVIVDRGLTMSAPGRLERLADGVASIVPDALGDGPTRFVAVPGGLADERDRAAWRDVVAALPPTAADTSAELSAAVARATAAGDADLVLVLSDQRLDAPPSDRLVQIAPANPLSDTGIIHLAARALPRPQVMVRLRRTPDGPAELPLSISSGGAVTSARAVFEEGAADATAFVDVPQLGPTVEAAIDVADDLPANDRGWLVRRAAWPRVEPQVPLSRELERMVEAYARQRPADEASPVVPVVGPDQAAATAGPAVVVATAGLTTTLPVGGEHVVADHPVTRDVDWRAALAGARVSPAPGGWTPVVSVGGRAAVAVREAPARQVWVGFEVAALPRSPAYVVFWTNVFDWVGQGGDAFVAETVTPLESRWRRIGDGEAPQGTPNGMWPGLYRRDDGAARALNAPPADVPPPRPTDWRARLDAVRRDGGTSLGLAAPLAVVAVACVVLAAVAWPSRRPRTDPREPTPANRPPSQ